ncbi:hypothetical protein VU04_10600 [Desulfobulbus sp. TB]|nr:hypothetical protein [Desulfobulbus sp. TB]
MPYEIVPHVWIYAGGTVSANPKLREVGAGNSSAPFGMADSVPTLFRKNIIKSSTDAIQAFLLPRFTQKKVDNSYHIRLNINNDRNHYCILTFS